MSTESPSGSRIVPWRTRASSSRQMDASAGDPGSSQASRGSCPSPCRRMPNHARASPSRRERYPRVVPSGLESRTRSPPKDPTWRIPSATMPGGSRRTGVTQPLARNCRSWSTRRRRNPPRGRPPRLSERRTGFHRGPPPGRCCRPRGPPTGTNGGGSPSSSPLERPEQAPRGQGYRPRHRANLQGPPGPPRPGRRAPGRGCTTHS